MKITGFRPMIVTKDQENVTKMFEELGFERAHTKTNVEDGANPTIALKDSNNNRIVVSYSENMPKDLPCISINVDNFQEAYDFFIARGFVDPRGGKVTDTGTSKATLLFSPSGLGVNISEHIKD